MEHERLRPRLQLGTRHQVSHADQRRSIPRLLRTQRRPRSHRPRHASRRRESQLQPRRNPRRTKSPIRAHGILSRCPACRHPQSRTHHRDNPLAHENEIHGTARPQANRDVGLYRKWRHPDLPARLPRHHSHSGRRRQTHLARLRRHHQERASHRGRPGNSPPPQAAAQPARH